VTRLGVIFTADRPPEQLPAFAAAAEAAGLDELWLWQDCFLAGGIAASAVALAATNRVAVGLGVMPAVFRNPVAKAMEVATLARLHPGRFIAGLGHGVPTWMEQVGALPDKAVPAPWRARHHDGRLRQPRGRAARASPGSGAGGRTRGAPPIWAARLRT
jgi:alkanesulfonate monooxygenase SsuD/methylene tetrahydromethanopterin reductase-like flavin-dependent oxidoreductase (luciferase family)